MWEPDTSDETVDSPEPEREALRNSCGEVVHLVVKSAEGSWLPFDEDTAVERADEGISRLVESDSYA